MLWRLALALLVVAALRGDAPANGRPPGTSSITFRKGHESDIAIGLTFGLVVSHDGGKTWVWTCEDAIGYTGMYDPVYAYASGGALFATTYDGLKVDADGCTFAPTAAGASFASSTAIGADGAFYYAAAQPLDTVKGLAKDFQIYKSTDGGQTFPVKVKPGSAADINDWWETLVASPIDAKRLYLAGYSYEPAMAGAEPQRTQLLFRSTDGGASWQAMTLAGITPISSNTVAHIVGIAADKPDQVYLRMESEDNAMSDALYRSDNAGASWTRILGVAAPITGVVVRRQLNAAGKHDVIAGTQTLGTQVSHDDGATWTALVDPPHVRCLVENAAGEIWACTQNYSDPNVASDNAGVMKTTDLVTWTKVLRYQELTHAASCAAGSRQAACAQMWCAVCEQLGCTPDPSYACPQPMEAPVPPGKSGGCCDTGAGGGSAALALALAVGTLVLRPRRRQVPP